MSSIPKVGSDAPEYFKAKTATSQNIILAIGIIVLLGSTVFASLSIWQLNADIAANLPQTVRYIEFAASGLGFVLGSGLTIYALHRKQEFQDKLKEEALEQPIPVEAANHLKRLLL